MIDRMLRAARKAPLIRTTRKPQLRESVEQFLYGAWSVDDLLEVLVDETSTAASVGSGTDTSLGTAPVQPEDEEPDEQVEKLLRSYWDHYTVGSGLQEFVDKCIPGAPSSLVDKLRERIRKEDGKR